MSAIAYPVGEALYLNITNRCTNQCSFCIRQKSRRFNRQHPLWLEKEPEIEQILGAIKEAKNFNEIVFCGYGEPLIRLEAVKAVATELKKQLPTPRVRINTNGLANLFWGRNILPELSGLIDSLSVSLNATDPETYEKLCHSFYGQAALPAIIKFISQAKASIPEVEATIVELPGRQDKKAAVQLAKELGVKLRVRSYYEEEYIR